jgi:exopolyphosphatase/guanosine-5'-triphosphate,3'-diphosphate pyrophosphatase
LIRAVVSIGTNSTRALAASFDGKPRVLLSRSIGTRVGEGLKERGHLDERAMERTLDALREHTAAVRELTANVCAIATSALRRADNGAAFARDVEAIAGAQLEIISGEEEARRSFLGAVSGVEHGDAQSFGVLDTGGGSSEYAIGLHEPERVVSCEIGAVRLTEAVPELAGTKGEISDADIAQAREIARAATAEVAKFPHVDRLLFVGGTATTAISIERAAREYFEYADFPANSLRRQIEVLRRTPLEKRKKLAGMNPQRADILLAGLIILDTVLRSTNHTQAIVSTNDLLLGTLVRA